MSGPQQIALALLTPVLTAAGTTAGASIPAWQAHWSLRHESGALLGFDTNVEGTSNETVSDFYATLTQTAAVARRGGLTALRLQARAAVNQFATTTTANSIDGGFNLTAGYPSEGDSLSQWRLVGHWRTWTAPNLDVGQRLRQSSYGLQLAGEHAWRPKLDLTGAIDLARSSFADDRFNTNDSATVTLGVAHVWRPGLRWSGEYALETGRSAEPEAALRDTNMVIHTVGFRARGELSPKLNGGVFLGGAQASFTGAYDTVDTGPSVAADLVWTSTSRRTLRLSAHYRHDFSAEGEAARRASLRLDIEQQMSRGTRVTLFLSPARTTYARSRRVRADTTIAAGLALERNLTERFSAGLSLEWSDNQSTNPSYDIARTLGGIKATWRY